MSITYNETKTLLYCHLIINSVFIILCYKTITVWELSGIFEKEHA